MHNLVNFVIFAFNRIIFRIGNFIKHWYVTSFKIYVHAVISFFEKIDNSLALKITFKNLFKPLFQDRSIIGYFFGFVFRFFRIILGGVIYGFLFVLALAGFLLWVAIPLFIIYKIIKYSPAIETLNLTDIFN